MCHGEADLRLTHFGGKTRGGQPAGDRIGGDTDILGPSALREGLHRTPEFTEADGPQEPALEIGDAHSWYSSPSRHRRDVSPLSPERQLLPDRKLSGLHFMRHIPKPWRK